LEIALFLLAFAFVAAWLFSPKTGGSYHFPDRHEPNERRRSAASDEDTQERLARVYEGMRKNAKRRRKKR